MDDKGREMFTFQVSAEEAESINAAVRASGLSRSEYLRQRLTNPAEQPASGITGGNPAFQRSRPSCSSTFCMGCTACMRRSMRWRKPLGRLAPPQADKIAGGSMKASRDILAHLDERISCRTAADQVRGSRTRIKKPAAGDQGRWRIAERLKPPAGRPIKPVRAWACSCGSRCSCWSSSDGSS